jgi:hypothetical protein
VIMEAATPSNSDSKLSYLNIVISEKGLSEFSHGKRVVFIPKDEVQKIEVRYGSGAERPLAQIVVGLLLTALGCVGVAMIFASGMRGLRWGVGFIVFGALGAWCLYEAFKKTHYLQITCHKETRKLVLKGTFEEQAFSECIRNAARLGYSFDYRR